MSTSAHMMTESSVIKHYKKQLIHRQHDLPDQEKKIDQNGIYDFVESETRNDDKVNNVNNGKKTRKKRKNRNCRGQFRHEGMELIKLGTNTTHSLCKTKEPFNVRMEKTLDNPSKKEERPPKPEDPKEPQKSVIQSTFNEKTIILENHPPKPPQFGHSLPQMVPERRNSKEMNPPKLPQMERRNSTDSAKLPTVPYSSPTHLPPPPDYPTFTHLPYRPQPYPAPRSPPIRPKPIQLHHRSAFQPTHIVPPPYPGMHFPYSRHHHYSNGYTNAPLRANAPPPDSGEGRKRKQMEGIVPKPIKKPTPPVVAAIDLTVDQEQSSSKGHKCQCECGKKYNSEPVSQEVIITVAGDTKTAQVPTINLRGKLVNGVLKLDSEDNNKKEVDKISTSKISEKPPHEAKLPQLFLIKDLLAKGIRVEKKSSHHRIEEEVLKTSQPTVISPEEKPPCRRPQCEPHRVIVNTNDYRKIPTRSHTVNNIIGKSRRQSVDIDTISVSSGESIRSPNGFDKQIPQGKLFYYKNNNSFIRYFEDAQKKLFFDNLAGNGYEMKRGDEVIELPKNAAFSCKDSLTVEEYVNEMTLAERFIPKDFFFFYKFVTGYQICHNHFPVSFLTFLKVYNTNGLKDLLERYVASLKQAS